MRALGPAAIAAALLAGCSTLPTSGPTADEVLEAEAEAAARIGYRIVDVDAAVVAALPRPAADAGALAALARPPVRADRLGEGDAVEVFLFEVGTALFGGAGQAPFDPSARARSLGTYEVGEDGTITLPYAGEVALGGASPQVAAERIEAAFRGLSQRPQVQVRVARNQANAVLLTGAVAQQGRLPLSATPERLTEAIALRGGPAVPPEQLRLRFTRGGESADLPLSALVAGSAADLVLQPDDRIELLPFRRSILAYGAMNAVREIPFETGAVSLAEAVARAGGPSDLNADPSAVFVFRDDPHTPTIYRVNLMRPSGYFLAQRFPMQDKDLIYVANAAANRPSKLIDIINRLFTPLFTIEQLTR